MTVSLGLLGPLVISLGLCALAVAVLRRWPAQGLARGTGLTLRVLQRVTLGPRQGVALLQVDERVLVVSLGDQGAQLLAELEGESRSRALASLPQPSAAGLSLTGGASESRALRELVMRGMRALGSRTALLLVAASLASAGLATAQTAATPGAQRLSPPPVAAPAPAKGRVASTAVVAPSSRLPGPVVTPPPLPDVDIRIGEGKDQIRLTGAVGLVVFLGVLTLLPALFLLMTSFTRILIVMHFLRSALGTQTTPPGQLLVALSVLLTGVVMHPVLEKTNQQALQPYFQGQITQAEAYTQALQPFREFMLRNVREQDLATFAKLAHIEEIDSEQELPTLVVVSAFVISELRVAFQMGFVLYLPFVVVDVIVASVLMSLGMFMLPPIMISMPLKLLLFVLADGWTLIVQNLVASFR